MRVPRSLCVLGTVGLLFGLLTMADPAAAHEGEGVVAVEQRLPVAEDAVQYVVRLTWSADGHAASFAALAATPIGPDGVPGDPVPMWALDDDGRYTGVVTFPGPGPWTVLFTAPDPPTAFGLVEEIGVPVE